MARSKYQANKRQKEIAREKKQELKRQQKLEKKRGELEGDEILEASQLELGQDATEAEDPATETPSDLDATPDRDPAP